MAKAKAKIYARVLVDSLKEAKQHKQTEIMRAFKTLLQKRGDVRQLSAILREAEKLWHDTEGKLAKLVSAEALTSGDKESIEKFLNKVGYRMEEEIDPKLIGGMALILENSFVIDNTVRGKLQRIAKLL